MTASALYAGRVRHRRLGAVPRVIEHPITLAYLDLEELPRSPELRLDSARLLASSARL